MDELTSGSARALAEAIREKRVSSREAVEAHLRLIGSVNGAINAVAQLCPEQALEAARRADDSLLRAGAAGPLHGVPFTVKDWIETAGVICAAGFEARSQFVPARDATVVARLRSAGGIMLGKTIDGNDNPVYGQPHNPYDVSRTPGGSSSGEAALIAAGGSPLGLGSDSGGSIRFPAHCCGIAGLKPTTGRVPLTGHFPRIGALSDPRTQIGPMSRYTEDVALTLPIISGVDWCDPSVVPMPLGDWTAVELRGARVAVFTDFAGAKPSPETAAAVAEAGAALQVAGAHVEGARPERIEESLEITETYWRRVRSYSWNEWRAEGEHSLSPEQVERSIFLWDRLRRSFTAFIQHYDLVLCPVAEEAAGPERPASAQDFIYTLPFSLTGWPVAVVRAGTSGDGLPIGVQIAARPWRDDVALAAAHHLERTLGGWRPPLIEESPSLANK